MEQSSALEVQSGEQRRGGLHKITEQSEEGRHGPNRECVLGNNGAGWGHQGFSPVGGCYEGQIERASVEIQRVKDVQP